MQSAAIMLGLTPTILSYIGPTVGEIALNSTRRLVLAVFLMLGAPAVFATRPFDFDCPGESLKRDVGGFVLHKQTPSRAAAMTTVPTVLGRYQRSAEFSAARQLNNIEFEMFMALSTATMESHALGTSSLRCSFDVAF